MRKQYWIAMALGLAPCLTANAGQLITQCNGDASDTLTLNYQFARVNDVDPSAVMLDGDLRGNVEFTANCKVNTQSDSASIPDLATCEKTELSAGDDPSLKQSLPIRLAISLSKGMITGTLQANGMAPIGVSCGFGQANPFAPVEDDTPPKPAQPVKFSQILPVVQTNCSGCHSGKGPEAGGIKMADLDTLKSLRDIAPDLIESGKMPLGNPGFRKTADGQLLLQWLIYDGTDN